jgi:hypothetical protein
VRHSKRIFRASAWIVASVSVIASCLVWARYGSAVAHWADPTTPSLQDWGSGFAALSTLFTAVGFLAVLASLGAQRRALRVQQEEIDANRNEIDRNRREQQEQTHRQQFDATFFQLLTLMRELRENIRFPKDNVGGKFAGLEAIDVAVSELGKALRPHRIFDSMPAVTRVELGHLYEAQVVSQAGTGLSPYFRVIYTMLDRLRDDAVLRENEKIDYARLLRSQLNKNEAALVGANGTSGVSKDLFDLIVKFRMLKYAQDAVIGLELMQIYPPETFQARKL